MGDPPLFLTLHLPVARFADLIRGGRRIEVIRQLLPYMDRFTYLLGERSGRFQHPRMDRLGTLNAAVAYQSIT